MVASMLTMDTRARARAALTVLRAAGSRRIAGCSLTARTRKEDASWGACVADWGTSGARLPREGLKCVGWGDQLEEPRAAKAANVWKDQP